MLTDLLAQIYVPECSYVAVPEATEQALHYYHTGNILWILSLALSLVIPSLFLIKGFTGKLADKTKAWGKNWYGGLALYLVIFLAIYQVINLPFDYYTGYVREHEYGLSTQSLQAWFGNYGLAFLLTLIFSLAFIWIFYLILKKSPKRWWLYSGIISGILFFLMIVIQPIWIDPLYNNYSPMKCAHLKEEILELADRAGIKNAQVFEVDKSKETKTLNAYVTGLGGTERIVVWDTLIESMNPDQILFVMGHEMGHYVLNHIWWQFLYFTVLFFIIFYLTYLSSHVLIKKYGKDLGITKVSNISSFPLLIGLMTVFMTLSLPLTNCLCRSMERQADRFGLELTQNNQAAAEAFVILQSDNLANPQPGPIFMTWRASHPSLAERIGFINNYCPWRRDETLKYQKYFKSN